MFNLTLQSQKRTISRTSISLGGFAMKTLTATQARKEIYQLVQSVESSHEPVAITSKEAVVVMIAKSDWNAIQETLHLVSIPGMKESIVEGLNTPVSKCKKLEW